VLCAVVLALCLAGAVLLRPGGAPELARSAPEPSPRFFERLRGKIDATVDRFKEFTGREKENRLRDDQVARHVEERLRKAASARADTSLVACTWVIVMAGHFLHAVLRALRSDDKKATIETPPAIASSSKVIISAVVEEDELPPRAQAEDCAAALVQEEAAAMPATANTPTMEDAPAAAATLSASSQPLAAPAPPSPPAVAEPETPANVVACVASGFLGDFVYNYRTSSHDWVPEALAAASPVNP